MNYFFLVKDGKKRYLCATNDLVNNLKIGKLKTDPFFKYEKSFFSTKIESDEIHSIIKNELTKLVFELDEKNTYSYDEMIIPLLREAKLKEIL
jgi:hypothetical protein